MKTTSLVISMVPAILRSKPLFLLGMVLGMVFLPSFSVSAGCEHQNRFFGIPIGGTTNECSWLSDSPSSSSNSSDSQRRHEQQREHEHQQRMENQRRLEAKRREEEARRRRKREATFYYMCVRKGWQSGGRAYESCSDIYQGTKEVARTTCSRRGYPEMITNKDRSRLAVVERDSCYLQTFTMPVR